MHRSWPTNGTHHGNDHLTDEGNDGLELSRDRRRGPANLLDDPRAMLGRMTGLLEKLLSKQGASA